MKQRSDLTVAEKLLLVQFLMEGSSNGRVAHGRRAAAVIRFNSSIRTVTRVWAEARRQQAAGQVISLHSGKHNERAKRVHIDVELIKSLEMGERSSVRRLAEVINCSNGTVGRWNKKGLIEPHTNAIKPDLTAPNKFLRLRFSLEALELDRQMNTLRFRSMESIVHIDEKWFYMTKGVHRFYQIPGEDEPHRTCKSKKFISKVMFMCAVSRPIYNADGTLLFDGKIGMWPFTQQVPAKRASKNRAAGTLETKSIESVTKEVVRGCILNQILPAIKEKWPVSACKHIHIQQDNAKPHIQNSDALFREAADEDGFHFTLIQQPPNSPDTNVNDLGWFRSIEALQATKMCTTVDALVGAVLNAFDTLDHTTLNNVFLSLQGCMIKVMTVRGGNNYKLPHMGKEALIRAGNLPLNLEVPKDLVRDCLSHLIEAGQTDGVEFIMDALDIELTTEGEEED